MDVLLYPLESHLLVQKTRVWGSIPVELIRGKETKGAKSVIHGNSHKLVSIRRNQRSQVVVPITLSIATTVDPNKHWQSGLAGDVRRRLYVEEQAVLAAIRIVDWGIGA